MEIKIRKAEEQDMPALLGLIKEFATFLNKPEKVKINIDDLIREKDHFQCLFAENDKGKIMGYALFFCTFHTWGGKAIYLDDLYIKEEYRRHSVGSMLIYALVDQAKRQNCKSLRWQVLNWNKEAIDFYKKLGATVGDDNLNCDLAIK